jgi:hypothetical protein
LDIRLKSLKKFSINELKILTHVIIFTILLVSISLTNSKAIPQQNVNKIQAARDYGDIPFKFPMPLEDMNNHNLMGSTHSKSKESPHLKNGLLSNTKSTQKQQTILKAMLIPENKIVKTKILDSSKNSTIHIEEASSHVNLAGINGSKEKYKPEFDHQNYPISYHITGAGNKIKDFNVEKDNTTIIAHITSRSNGKLTVQLPENATLDFKKPKNNNQEDSFAVFEDGQYYPAFNEGKNLLGVRQVIVYFEKGTEQIEILTSHTSPEFGMIFPIAFSLTVISLMIARMYFQRSIRKKIS